LDETVFDTITEESAYWAGFLMADGSIVSRERWSGNPTVSLVLSARDEDHVIAFRSFLGSGHAIIHINDFSKRGTPRAFRRLCVSSTHLVNSLARFGVVPRKTFRTKALLLEKNKDFWRGIIDGDGSIGFTRGLPRLRLAGSKKLLQQFSEYAHAIYKHNATVRPRRTIFLFGIAGRPALSVITHLYADCAIALPRKLAIAQQIMS